MLPAGSSSSAPVGGPREGSCNWRKEGARKEEEIVRNNKRSILVIARVKRMVPGVITSD